MLLNVVCVCVRSCACPPAPPPSLFPPGTGFLEYTPPLAYLHSSLGCSVGSYDHLNLDWDAAPSPDAPVFPTPADAPDTASAGVRATAAASVIVGWAVSAVCVWAW
jgi:hypothetical protein